MAVLRQMWTMSAVYLTYITIGLTSGDHEGNLESHSYFLFTIIGYIISSVLMDKIGRRSTYIVGISPGLISCLLINYENTELLIIRKLLCGISLGGTSILGIMIIGEYTSPKYRAVFLNFTTACVCFGQLLRQVLDPHYQMSTIVNLTLILKVISLAITVTWPESPHWLASKERYEDCKASFDYLRSDTESAQEKKDLLQRNKTVQCEQTLVEMMTRFYKTCLSKELRRPVTIVIFGAILVEASGKHYLPKLALHYVTAIRSGMPLALYVSIITTISCLCACLLIYRFKQRKMLLTAGFSAIVSMFFGSIYVFLLTNNLVSYNSSWIGTSLIFLHMICSNLGLTSIPTVLIGEVFPLEYKAIGCLVSGVITSTVSWAIGNMASCLLAGFQVYGTLAIFGMLMAISIMFLFVILPETKGRTLLEIEDYFNYGCFSEDCFDDKMGLT